MQNTRNRNKASSEKEKRDLKKIILANIAESFFVDGLLQEKDFENKELLQEKIRDLLRKADDIGIIINHQESILDEAQKYIRKSKHELAYVFYAIYFEHFINGVIQIKCRHEHISNSTYKELVRRLSLEDKFTWAAEILRLPKFNTNHLQIIKTIGERRNSFIHYKYQPEPEELTSERDGWKKIEKNITDAITYCKTYETRVLYNGKSRKLRLKKYKK